MPYELARRSFGVSRFTQSLVGLRISRVAMTRTIANTAGSRYAALRARAWPILQTAAAAVAAWYLAKLLLPSQEPVFASVAAVIALGATYGQRPERAIELIGGVVLGIGVADLIIYAI